MCVYTYTYIERANPTFVRSVFASSLQKVGVRVITRVSNALAATTRVASQKLRNKALTLAHAQKIHSTSN